MKDIKALACVNMYAVLGAIPTLCLLSDEAKAIIGNEKIAIGFSVKGGPSATLRFADGKCTMENGTKKCNIKLPFSSHKRFCDMIDGKASAFPSKGFLRIGFLLKKFIPLTDLLSKYLRPEKNDLENEKFFDISTRLMLRVIGGAICQLANNDNVSKFSASNIVDGTIKFSIKGSDSLFIKAENGILSLTEECQYRSYMEFESIQLARDVFDGKVNSVAAVGLGKIRFGGMVSMVDNINRILDRVSLYLA